MRTEKFHFKKPFQRLRKMRDGLLRQPNRTKLRCHNLANKKANTKTQSQFEKNEND